MHHRSQCCGIKRYKIPSSLNSKLVPCLFITTCSCSTWCVASLLTPHISWWHDEACKPVGNLNLACRSVLKFKLNRINFKLWFNFHIGLKYSKDCASLTILQTQNVTCTRIIEKELSKELQHLQFFRILNHSSRYTLPTVVPKHLNPSSEIEIHLIWSWFIT